MISTGLLLTLVAIAGITDIRSRKIPNTLTYPGLAAALALNLATIWFSDDSVRHWQPLIGWVGWRDSLSGLAVCGLFMLVCFVFFGIGGGDVKLLAMMGAFLGLEHGLEALLWTFILGACLGLSLLVWRVGIPRLLAQAWRQLRAVLRWGIAPGLTDEERKPFKSDLFLAPSALAAIAIVQFL
ncbi:MAG TPA: A24 family peptidase [Pirellulaceae bacterium]|nr:A24 family peptidase [Pirellulaceae bacterium]